MAGHENMQQQPTAVKKKNKMTMVIKWLGGLFLALLAALAVMFSTDQGSKFLLDRVLSTQKMLSYEYGGGSFLRGLTLNHVDVNLDGLEVKAKSANVVLGWRAIVNKEVHFYKANIEHLEIINKKPPSDKPFEFSDIRLPVTLRFNHANVDLLEIKNTTSTLVSFKDIQLKDAIWKETHLTFDRAALDMGYLAVKDAQGEMDFQHKYPINAKAKVILPSLKSIRMEEITVDVKGTLDRLAAGFATETPDLLSGYMIVHPVRDNVPMNGEVHFNRYHLPFVDEQQLYIEKGTAKLIGSASNMSIQLMTDLMGKDVPKGNYQANLLVDYVHGLKINQFHGDVLNGTVDLTGNLNWEKALTWDATGRIRGIDPNSKEIPEVAREFLPKNTNNTFNVTGNLDQGLHLNAALNFDTAESWKVKLDQPDNKPMLMNIAWNNIDRAMPYIGWLTSKNGQTDIKLDKDQQDIIVSTSIAQHEKGTLPTGQYAAKINLKGNDLNVPEFKYVNGASQLLAKATVLLPTEKRELTWNADVSTKAFNPQTIAPTAPINLLNGSLKASGYAQKNQQTIELKGIDLTGTLAQQKNETVSLTGTSKAILTMKPQGGLDHYHVVYDGGLKSSQYETGNGILKLDVTGTTETLKITQFKHDGAAGNISADGNVAFKDGVNWNINASLMRFKPHYFVSDVRGEVSGIVKTRGAWSDRDRHINIDSLDLAGIINNQPLRGKGNLAVVMNTKNNQLMPQQFEANNLFFEYAGNQLQATGNTKNLNIKLNAPALFNLYSGLRGKAYGYIDVQTQSQIKAVANLAVDNFGYKEVVSVEKVRVQGELPTSETTPTALKAELENVRSGTRQLQYGALRLSGTRGAHVLSLQAWNRYSKFYVQLAGGLNAQNDWSGQIQKGVFDSVRAVLNQQQNANVTYQAKDKTLNVGQHCWASQQSQLCFDQPIVVSPTKGNVSFATKNLNLGDFAAFMPEGLAITGQLNGYAKAAWAQGKRPELDAKFITQNGKIGLTSDSDTDLSTTTSYEQISVLAKSVQDGLQLRADVKTKDIGTSYANVIINPYDDRLPMRGEVAISQVNLQFLKPFIQGVRSIHGTLDFAGKISGTLNKPLMNGDLSLKDGAISMISLPVDLKNIQMYGAIRQDQANLAGTFNSGQGTGKIESSATWADEPRVQVKLSGDQLLVRQAPLITAIVTPQMNVDAYPLKRTLTVKGKIEVPRAIINMPESSPNVVSVSPDVRVVHSGDDPLAVLKAAKPWNIHADIDLQLGDRVIFQGFNSRIPLTGRLYLSQRGLETAMSANGAIGVSQKVKVEAYGQTMDLNRAIARFDGPLANPTLDVDTNKKISNTLVGVRVTGTASAPNIQVYNDGGLSEQEALNALITGRINEGSSSLSQTEGFKSDVNNTLAAAGISLGLGGTRAFTNQIGRTFGLSGLALDAQGTGDDTQVSVTGYLTPDLYLRYGVGVFTPVNKLTLRYQMNKRLYLEASQSVERAIDVFYNWKF